MRAVMALSLLLAANVDAATITGTITFDESPMPGCAVTVRSYDAPSTESPKLSRMTDAAGRYAFQNVPAGVYVVDFSVEGLGRATRMIGLEVDSVATVDETLKPNFTSEEIVSTCGIPCDETPPANAYDLPLCEDYEFVSDLIERLPADGSLVAMLELRFDQEPTITIRQLIASALAKDAKWSGRYEKYLAADAELALRYCGHGEATTPQLEAAAAEKGVTADAYREALYGAFYAYSECPDSRPFLLRVMAEATDASFVQQAIYELGVKQSIQDLPAIADALERFHDEDPTFGVALVEFRDPRAHELARRYMTDTMAESYDEQVREREAGRGSDTP